MRFDDNKWVTNILKVVDTLNTLNGGMSSPSFKLNKNDDNYLLALKAPGVSPEAMRVEVVEDKLMIYHLLDFGNEEQEIVPNIINVIPIPNEVDIKKISAEYEDKRLLVLLPFGEKSEGYYRSVDINVITS
jgi:HSP20 family molecular chaperone IbpA